MHYTLIEIEYLRGALFHEIIKMIVILSCPPLYLLNVLTTDIVVLYLKKIIVNISY